MESHFTDDSWQRQEQLKTPVDNSFMTAEQQTGIQTRKTASTPAFLEFDQSNWKSLYGQDKCSLRSIDELSKCIQDNKKTEISYPAIFDSGVQALIFAEAHGANAHRNELISSLESLKKAGATHLVLEQMPSSKQDLITQFRQHKIGEAELTKEISDFWGWQPESYVRLIEAALDKGIDVKFMDSDREAIDLSSPNWQQLELEARQRREAHWLDVFESIFKENHDARVIVLVGSGHAETGGKTQPLQRQLASKNIVPGVITLEGGEYFYGSNLTEAARLAKLTESRFVVPTKPSDSPTESIFHIHLPETASPIGTHRDSR
jgi:hypothetical protein